MRISKKESGEMKCTAYNKRFGISAGVFSQKHLYEFASLSPVRTAVKPPPTPSRRTLWFSGEKSEIGIFRFLCFWRLEKKIECLLRN